ncbi:MAG: hypothetical protein ACJAWV_004454 [Flammeovirgaceae bacterium]|jgi:hypothetical protein
MVAIEFDFQVTPVLIQLPLASASAVRVKEKPKNVYSLS